MTQQLAWLAHIKNSHSYKRIASLNAFMNYIVLYTQGMHNGPWEQKATVNNKTVCCALHQAVEDNHCTRTARQFPGWKSAEPHTQRMAHTTRTIGILSSLVSKIGTLVQYPECAQRIHPSKPLHVLSPEQGGPFRPGLHEPGSGAGPGGPGLGDGPPHLEGISCSVESTQRPSLPAHADNIT